MKNILLALTYLSILLLLNSCSKSEYLDEGDYFHLDNKGAKMPIWVTGNMESDVLLVTIAGGPGDSGMGFHVNEGFKLLEEDIAIAYWDQRFCGMAQGTPGRETLDPEQFVEDTEKLVALLSHKYPDKKLFMLGFSWGGQLSAGYLGKDNNDSQFKGWIDLDGAISSELEVQLMKEWIVPRVEEKLEEEGVDKDYWQFILDYYENNEYIGNYEHPEPYWYVSALGGDAYNYEENKDKYAIPYVELIFRSMFSLSYYVNATGHPEEAARFDLIDYTKRLKNIEIPTLLLWGADDAVVPVGVADYVYDQIGTPETDKEIVLIEECGHGPFADQPERFYQEAIKFINTYK